MVESHCHDSGPKKKLNYTCDPELTATKVVPFNQCHDSRSKHMPSSGVHLLYVDGGMATNVIFVCLNAVLILLW